MNIKKYTDVIFRRDRLADNTPTLDGIIRAGDGLTAAARGLAAALDLDYEGQQRLVEAVTVAAETAVEAEVNRMHPAGL